MIRHKQANSLDELWDGIYNSFSDHKPATATVAHNLRQVGANHVTGKDDD